MKDIVKTHDSYVTIEIQGHRNRTDLFVKVVNDEHHVMCFDLDKEDALEIAEAIIKHYSGENND